MRKLFKIYLLVRADSLLVCPCPQASRSVPVPETPGAQTVAWPPHCWVLSTEGDCTVRKKQNKRQNTYSAPPPQHWNETSRANMCLGWLGEDWPLYRSEAEGTTVCQGAAQEQNMFRELWVR